MPIKTLGSLGKIRVGRVTGNTHIFFFGLNLCIMRLYYACGEKKKLISMHNCISDLCFVFFSKSNCRFHCLSHDATFTMPLVLKYVRIAMHAMHLQLIFQYLHSNCCSVVFWVVAILIWPSLLCPARLDQSAQL